MKYYKLRLLLSVILFIGCNRIDNQVVDKLGESDKIDVLKQIIKEEKIENLDDEFVKIDSNDSTLYYITYFPNDVQRYNRSSSLIAFNKLFDKKDLFEFKKQINSFDTSYRLSKFNKDDRNNISSISDSSRKDGIKYYISYPLLNRRKNAVIVFLQYYGGELCSADLVLIYAKKSGKWIRLSTILVMIS
jgi:hypothetical protein